MIPKEKYEHVDLVGGEPAQDPTTLRAHEGDHTPNVGEKPGIEKLFHRGNL